MKNKQWILPTLVCLLPILAYLVVYEQLPEMMPIHFNAEGIADGFMPKQTAVYLPCLLLAGVELLCFFAMKTDPKRENYAKQLKTLSIWICPILSVVMNGVILMICLDVPVRMDAIVPFACGGLFVIIGNYMPKIKQNYTMGIKLPWTLNSVENWNKTHRFGGFVFVLMG